MDFQRALSTTLAILIVSLCFCEVGVAQGIFPDKNLEAVVRKNVFEKRNNTEPLTAKDVENISSIEGKGKGIKNLKGLEFCRSLALLDLEENEFSDLNPIKGLTRLQSLNLGKNKIKDIAPLVELNKLQLLNLAGNEIADIKPLAKMSNMRTLYLSRNQVKDISVLEKLPKIWSLYLDENPVKDLQIVGKLKWLSSLSLKKMKLEKLDAIRPLKELKYLNLQENNLSDVSVLLEMAKADSEQEFALFWRVYLNANPLSDAAMAQIVELKKIGGRIYFEKK